MFRKLTALTLVAAVTAGTVVVFTPDSAQAATTTTTTKKTAVVAVEKDPYAFTARPGDSYTVLARKALQTYGIRENVKQSQAQIVAAETFLTSNAGFPALNEGQAVTFKKDDVKAAIKQAQGLTEAQLAAWQTYVPYINFDTRDNG